jgi:hypothetical protein
MHIIYDTESLKIGNNYSSLPQVKAWERTPSIFILKFTKLHSTQWKRNMHLTLVNFMHNLAMHSWSHAWLKGEDCVRQSMDNVNLVESLLADPT